ncbi:MAG TPA: thioredoxin family protein [Flavobacteriales bacterium]|nr:thioredoxin family protein [Flavobacteriales bacterium]HIL66423.1 thioredoxin family protein [Flavobacteriales bacterium]
MKHLLVVVLIAFSLNGFAQQKPLEWHTDVNKAIKISVETEKPLFFFFTGSDWCGWCKRLQKEVFFKPEFAIWANKNVVLVELDFPRRTKLSAELQKQNRELGQMFGVRGYPTIWFVTPVINGKQVDLLEKKLGSQGYVAGGPNAWIAGANKIIKPKK